MYLAQWLATLTYFQGLCAYNGEKPAETLDHVVVPTRGGGTIQEIYAPACLPCNLRLRGDKTRLDSIRRFMDHLERKSSA